jgi:hypothetical protein
MMFKLDIRAIGENNVEDSLGASYGVRFKTMAVIIVVDDSVHILQRQVRMKLDRYTI